MCSQLRVLSRPQRGVWATSWLSGPFLFPIHLILHLLRWKLIPPALNKTGMKSFRSGIFLQSCSSDVKVCIKYLKQTNPESLEIRTYFSHEHSKVIIYYFPSLKAHKNGNICKTKPVLCFLFSDKWFFQPKCEPLTMKIYFTDTPGEDNIKAT